MTPILHRRRFLELLALSPLAQGQTGLNSPADAFNVFDFVPAAQKNITKWHWAYLMTGADDDLTLKRNSEAYREIQLRVRRFVDVSRIDTSVRIFGETLASPVCLSPVGSQRAFHQQGELAVARAAAKRGHQMILSNMTSHHVRDVARAYERPPWYQLYPTDSFEIATHLIRQAESAGCTKLFLTVDSPGASNRETMLRGGNKRDAVCQSCHENSVQGYMKKHPMYDGADHSKAKALTGPFTWEWIRRIRGLTKMNLIAKGVMTREDAAECVKNGFDGVMVSNHGGRQEESLMGTIEALPEVAEAVGGRIPVIVDGGIRRGTDVFKALALGATAVSVGRPYIWGLGAFGQPGVERVLELLQAELITTMKLAGATSIGAITRDYVRVNRSR
jgi:4-hydroxymandelate oxidase